MIFILIFIIILNVVTIVLTYHCLGDLLKKERLIFIVVGLAVMYALTSVVYWISTNGIEITEVSETGKNLITLLFVPINGLVILPLLAKSYYKYKTGGLDKSVLLKRGTVLGVLLVIVLIFECIYFKNIQEQVVNLIEENQVLQQQENQNTLNENVLEQEEQNSLNENVLEQDGQNSLNETILTQGEQNDLNQNKIVQENQNVINDNTFEQGNQASNILQ